MIEIKNLSFSYGEKNILDKISFDLNQGLSLAVLGNNGAGKSTMIKCINKILKPQEGSVYIDFKNLTELDISSLARQMAYVAQKNEISDCTVYDAVLLGRKPYIKWKVTENDHKVVKRAIETMELQAFEMRNISELSGGELQKVMLARAMAQEPKLLLLDEPTSSLDPRNQYSVMRQICRISKSENIAVIVIIHDLNLAMRYCDRFLFLKDGKIFAYGGQEIMTKACLESVYEMAFDIIDYNGTKVSIPCPSNINWK